MQASNCMSPHGHMNSALLGCVQKAAVRDDQQPLPRVPCRQPFYCRRCPRFQLG